MKISAQELAAITGGAIKGNPAASVSSFAKIEEATPGSLTFLANPKYTHHIYNTGATIALVAADFNPEHPLPEGLTLICVDNPYETLAKLMTMVSNMQPRKKGIEQPCFIAEGVTVPESAYVGAFAYIGAGAHIGENVQIYPQVYIGDGASIGDDTIIYAGARVYPKCCIGKRCVIHAGAVIGADGFGFAPSEQGYEKIPQMGIARIEDDVEIGANTTVDRATMGETVVGHGCKLDNLIQIAHNVVLGEHNVMASQSGIAGSAKLGDWNMVGGQVGIAGHISVGSRNQIAAQSGLHRSLADDARVMGSPVMDFADYARLQVVLKRLPEIYKNFSKK